MGWDDAERLVIIQRYVQCVQCIDVMLPLLFTSVLKMLGFLSVFVNTKWCCETCINQLSPFQWWYGFALGRVWSSGQPH